jgi:hypothetical protein
MEEQSETMFYFKPHNHWNVVTKEVYFVLKAAGYGEDFLKEEKENES